MALPPVGAEEGWQPVFVNMPQQGNGWDCGVFALRIMEHYMQHPEVHTSSRHRPSTIHPHCSLA